MCHRPGGPPRAGPKADSETLKPQAALGCCRGRGAEGTGPGLSQSLSHWPGHRARASATDGAGRGTICFKFKLSDSSYWHWHWHSARVVAGSKDTPVHGAVSESLPAHNSQARAGHGSYYDSRFTDSDYRGRFFQRKLWFLSLGR